MSGAWIPKIQTREAAALAKWMSFMFEGGLIRLIKARKIKGCGQKNIILGVDY